MRRPFSDSDFKLGILGGGQLGKMLCQSASRWDLHTRVLDQSLDFPAGTVAREFREGNFTQYDDVISIGDDIDVATIEIESVNSDGLRALRERGIKVHPDPDALDIIKDKGLQKQFYNTHGIPTSDFEFYSDKDEIRSDINSGRLSFPFVLKARRDGYDGRGVAIIKTPADLDDAFDADYMIEALVDIELEIAVIAARNESGDIKTFPPVGMQFHPTANLVEFLYCPVNLDPRVIHRAEEIAIDTIRAFHLCGLLAIEMFLTKDGQILVNEVAPRPHNSGHHTIEACNASQFEQHLRGILNLPLVDIELMTPAVMINILGAEGFTGPPSYTGFDEIMKLPGVYPHIYGKTMTKPFRKMGHITITGSSLEQAIEKANLVRSQIKVIS